MSQLIKTYDNDPKYSKLNLPIYLDEPRLQAEWDKVDQRLKGIVLLSASIMLYEYNTPMVLTHIYRTQAEQDAIYATDMKYQKAPWQSVHQYHRGVDARVTDLGQSKANSLALKINSMFDYDQTKSKKVVLVHDVGQGNHIHFQIGAK
jgi:hypothetical protein